MHTPHQYHAPRAYVFDAHRLSRAVVVVLSEWAARRGRTVVTDELDERTRTIIQDCWDLLDDAKNGTITKRELTKAAEAVLGPGRYGEHYIDSIFRLMDRNHDGVMDFTDFRGFMAANMSAHRSAESVLSSLAAAGGGHGGGGRGRGAGNGAAAAGDLIGCGKGGGGGSAATAGLRVVDLLFAYNRKCKLASFWRSLPAGARNPWGEFEELQAGGDSAAAPASSGGAGATAATAVAAAGGGGGGTGSDAAGQAWGVREATSAAAASPAAAPSLRRSPTRLRVVIPPSGGDAPGGGGPASPGPLTGSAKPPELNPFSPVVPLSTLRRSKESSAAVSAASSPVRGAATSLARLMSTAGRPQWKDPALVDQEQAAKQAAADAAVTADLRLVFMAVDAETGEVVRGDRAVPQVLSLKAVARELRGDGDNGGGGGGPDYARPAAALPARQQQQQQQRGAGGGGGGSGSSNRMTSEHVDAMYHGMSSDAVFLHGLGQLAEKQHGGGGGGETAAAAAGTAALLPGRQHVADVTDPDSAAAAVTPETAASSRTGTPGN